MKGAQHTVLRGRGGMSLLPLVLCQWDNNVCLSIQRDAPAMNAIKLNAKLSTN